MKIPNIKLIIAAILILIVVIDTIIISRLQKKIENLTILTYESDSLMVVNPGSFREPKVLVTTEFIEKFSKYESPFNDSLSFSELIDKYIRNKWADHYGAGRGTREKKRIHEGIDLFVPENTPLYPLADYGIVTEVSDNPHYLVEVEYTKPNGDIGSSKIEYGKTVRIMYPEGIESIYTHLNEVYVTLGQRVSRKTKVALTGLTGNIRNSGKPSHLHLELRDKNNKSFDPRRRLHFTQGSINNFIDKLSLD